MNPLRFGAADFIANRPLVHGLVNGNAGDARLAFESQVTLADSFGAGRYDAALVPSIEYLRGTGRYLLPGPALVGRSGPGGVVLLAQKPLGDLERIAVGEGCRTPIAALRVVLAEQQHVLPDLCVEKRLHDGDWRDRYDAVLFSGDAALHVIASEPADGLVRFNVVEMWKSLTQTSLVHSVWVCDDASRVDEIQDVLAAARGSGLERLVSLAEEIGAALSVSPMTVYDYLTGSWSYDLGDPELDGLRALGDLALKYDLVRENRSASVQAA